MSKVKINDEFMLFSDGLSLHVSKIFIIKSGKHAGEETYRRISGYHNSLYALIESLERKRFLSLLKSDEYIELQEMAERQKIVHEEIRQFCADLMKKVESGEVEL